MIVNFPANCFYRFIHFAQNVIGRIGPNFDESFFQKKSANVFYVCMFEFMACLLDFLTNRFVGNENADFGHDFGFSYTECSAVDLFAL